MMQWRVLEDDEPKLKSPLKKEHQTGDNENTGFLE